MLQTSGTFRATVIILGLASVLTLLGCSKSEEVSPKNTPLPSSSSALVAPGASDLPEGVRPLFQQDLVSVTAATGGKFAQSGRYIVADKPYGSFDTLTEVKFEGGTVGYFVTAGGMPFGAPGASIAAPADEATAEFSALPKVEGSSQKAVQALFADYKNRLN